MIEAGKVSLLVHTTNRPRFLLRLLDYYDSAPELRSTEVIVLDASGPEAVAEFERERRGRDYAFPLRIVRHDPSMALYRRMAAGLDMIDTPYVILAAEDDLYFFDWIPGAIELLDSDPSFGTVYGHTLKFELDSFVPYGAEVKFSIDRVTNPPDRWLEGGTPAERLAELGNSESNAATTGWYALQRASQLRAITDLSIRHQLTLHFFERLMVFTQAAMHKTRRLDRLYLARQVAPGHAWPPLSFRDSPDQVEGLKRACRELLAGLGYDERSAEGLVAHALRGEFAQMRRADSKRLLRRIANAFPFLRKIWGWLRPGADRPYPRDERLPPPPTLDECRREIEIVRRVVSGAARAGIRHEPRALGAGA
jgi:glycosyltransferase domain-containing protein